ncbi:hypothetical protein GE09DRAFT_82811 [Coniochaeta sp. 2T2.1]|nr:hypothetical protein GE09DRAFT_82811 [Coniochaeta sp. 2T2.1]
MGYDGTRDLWVGVSLNFLTAMRFLFWIRCGTNPSSMRTGGVACVAFVRQRNFHRPACKCIHVHCPGCDLSHAVGIVGRTTPFQGRVSVDMTTAPAFRCPWRQARSLNRPMDTSLYRRETLLPMAWSHTTVSMFAVRGPASTRISEPPGGHRNLSRTVRSLLVRETGHMPQRTLPRQSPPTFSKRTALKRQRRAQLTFALTSSSIGFVESRPGELTRLRVPSRHQAQYDLRPRVAVVGAVGDERVSG